MHHFFHSTDSHGNVVFNFNPQPIEELTTFALGYHEAAQTLAAKLAASRGYPDYEGYPVLFLYRHALELYMKAVVYEGARLLRLVSEEQVDTSHLFRRHELARLLPPIRAIFKEMGWNFEGSGLASFDEFEAFIRDLDLVDPGSYAFRYPVKRSGEAYLPRHFVINVVSFAQRMDTLLQFLEGAATGIEEHWVAEAESRYELQQFFAE
jgi:hypothetical protein